MYIGQIVIAIGQPFIYAASAKLAAYWFGPNEVSITILSNLLHLESKSNYDYEF